jgi:hypothetical protein
MSTVFNCNSPLIFGFEDTYYEELFNAKVFLGGWSQETHADRYVYFEGILLSLGVSI